VTVTSSCSLVGALGADPPATGTDVPPPVEGTVAGVPTAPIGMMPDVGPVDRDTERDDAAECHAGVAGRHDGVAVQVTGSVCSPAYRRLREWLVDACHARSLTQAEPAYTLGLPQTFVSKHKRGERRLDFVEVLEIADALHVDVRDLVGELMRRST
jgi:hypothetical protein